MVTKVSQNDFAQVKEQPISVVDFNATWCGPCQMMAPVLEELSEEMKHVKFYACDVDENPELAKEYGIVSIPALTIIKDGKTQGMEIGFMPKEKLSEQLSKYF